MANQRRKEMNAWDRMLLWAKSNQKVIWVVLLLFLAPTFAATGLMEDLLGRGARAITVERIWGQSVSTLDLQHTQERLKHVLALTTRADYNALQVDPAAPLPGLLQNARLLLGQLNPLDYYVFKEKALRDGLRVTDEELGTHIKELWQWSEALEQAQAEIQSRPPPDPKDAGRDRQSEFRELAKKKRSELGAADRFDAESWAAQIMALGGVAGRKQIRVRDFESMLRDLYLIAKLESDLRSSVQVTPREVFEYYQKEEQQRQPSWVEFKPSAALMEKVDKTLAAADVKAYYQGHRKELEKPLSLRAEWLLLPKEHFMLEAEKLVTDADVEKHYQENRNDYRRAAILPGEALFAPRTAEEKAAFDKALYLPLDEVKEKARAKAVELRALKDMRELSTSLRSRLFPAPAAGESRPAGPRPAVKFEDLVKESPFLKVGTTRFATREDAKEVFGDGFSSRVETWLATAQRQQSEKKPLRIDPPEFASDAEKGLIFYAHLELREPTLPPLEEIEKEVRQAIVKSKTAALLEGALKGLKQEINDGKKELAGVIAAGLEVEVAGEKVHVDAAPLATSKSYLGKQGTLMVPKPQEAAAEAGKGKKEGAAEAGDDDAAEDAKEEEVVHPASHAIIEALFGIAEKDLQKVAPVADEKEGVGYLVRFDGLIPANPANFDGQRKYLESQLVGEKQLTHFQHWRTEVYREARGLPQTEELAGAQGSS